MGSNSMDGIDGTIDGRRQGERTTERRRDGRPAGCSGGQEFEMLPAKSSTRRHPLSRETHIHTPLRHSMEN
jgi:hypothetical protein